MTKEEVENKLAEEKEFSTTLTMLNNNQAFTIGSLYEQLDSLKKVYNDLAENHAKQVIEIEGLRLRLVEATNREHDSAKILSLESELLKANGNLKEAIGLLKEANETLMDDDIQEFIDKNNPWLLNDM